MLRKINQVTRPPSRKAARIKDFMLCVLSAILLILSFPRTNFWILAWFGFVPVFFALNNKSQKEAFFLFFITGIIFWSGIIYWLAHVTLFGTILLILYLALYFGIFGLIIRPCTKHSAPYAMVFIPSVWVLLEYIRGHLITGFPWALLGYSQYINLPVIQIADITGVWGVSFLLMSANVAIVEIIWSVKRRLWPRLRTVVIIVTPFLFLTLYYGYSRLYLAPRTYHLAPIKISVVQGNIPQELKWAPAAGSYILDKYAELTAQAARLSPDLLVWPEASSPELLGEGGSAFEKIFSLAKAAKTSLLIGAVVNENNKYFNSALLINNQGKVTRRYDKLHLVPFGEYIPLKRILPFLETIVPIGDINPGREYSIFELEYPLAHELMDSSASRAQKVKFAVLICFEDLFPELSREFVRRGANFLLNITNDAWYKKTSAPYQHLQASVFRAVENRVFLVRSANTGVSGFIDPKGRIISKVADEFGRDIFVDGVDTQKIAVSDKPLTAYTRYGDIFIVVCVLFVLYGIIRKFCALG
ncbi:MAG: apolipoprotein N-acyltransferase [Candidatus Omnitrophica bacterium]|nr:apolipoprotein N-acyltransferase [Candidatus Omnitrophota bacterium]